MAAVLRIHGACSARWYPRYHGACRAVKPCRTSKIVITGLRLVVPLTPASGNNEIVPLTPASGKRTYVLFQPFVLVPNMTVTIGLYSKPKQYADMDAAIGEVLSSELKDWREEQIGSGQAWYYHTDHILVLWECFLSSFVREESLSKDQTMRPLWTRVEQWLVRQLPGPSIHGRAGLTVDRRSDRPSVPG
jgi:hypothetical protein